MPGAGPEVAKLSLKAAQELFFDFCLVGRKEEEQVQDLKERFKVVEVLGETLVLQRWSISNAQNLIPNRNEIKNSLQPLFAIYFGMELTHKLFKKILSSLVKDFSTDDAALVAVDLDAKDMGIEISMLKSHTNWFNTVGTNGERVAIQSSEPIPMQKIVKAVEYEKTPDQQEYLFDDSGNKKPIEERYVVFSSGVYDVSQTNALEIGAVTADEIEKSRESYRKSLEQAHFRLVASTATDSSLDEALKYLGSKPQQKLK